MISKTQINVKNYYYKEVFYERARDAMFDIVNELTKLGYQKIYIPGYIGWSPKEGSGIFDPINRIKKLDRYYYLMNKNLNIDINYLKENLSRKSILLVVNYFGFRDKNICELIDYAHSIDCVVIEDNAHGFFTYHLSNKVDSDFTFFSLHKMFPFKSGGSLIVNNEKFAKLDFTGNYEGNDNPYSYRINDIAKQRVLNFQKINSIVTKYPDLIKSLRTREDIDKGNIPQTYPVILLKGNRDKIYESMNNQGYGVVSLYHTMIEELQENKYKNSLYVSKRIMNLPLHQDVDSNEYEEMIRFLVRFIEETDKDE